MQIGLMRDEKSSIKYAAMGSADGFAAASNRTFKLRD
jgi:hypothetical protein